MSPQPDVSAPLDVQKYIGPCLISQKPRVRKSNRVKEKYMSSNSDTMLMANNNNNNNSSINRLNVNDYRKLRNGMKVPSPPPPPHAYAICECCGSYKFTMGSNCSIQQAPPQPVHHINLPLTGFPLISMNSLSKKHGSNKSNCRKSSEVSESTLYLREERGEGGHQQRAGQLSRLAVHTEGAPLILPQRYNNNYNRKYKKYNSLWSKTGQSGKFIQQYPTYASPPSSHLGGVNYQDFVRDFNEVLDLTNGCYVLPAVHGSSFEEGHGCHSSTSLSLRGESGNRQNSPLNSDCMSVTSEESSSLSECNFPTQGTSKSKKRRKRTLKDELASSSPSSAASTPPPIPNGTSSDNPRTLVTLRPYMPLCYSFGEKDGFNDWSDDEAEIEEEEVDGSEEEEEEEEVFTKNYLANFEPETQNGSWSTKYPFPSSPLCRCTTCTAVITPPHSPSNTTSSDSGSSSLSESLSPFPTPPASPTFTPATSLALTSNDMWLSPYVSNYDVASRIVSTYGNNTGSKDLEIKFLYDNHNQCYRQYYQQPSQHQYYSDLINADNTHFSLFDHFSQSSSSDDNRSAFKQPHVVTTSQPPSRPWITLAQPTRTHPVCTFTVMCYNVLCDKYATRQMYGYCPNWALNWEYRRKGIMDEIRHYMADVISLQEVETEQFYNMFLPELKKDGYEGIFSPKSRAKTMSENDRKYVDGCAIFFKSNKFRLIKEYLVEFTQLAIAIAEGSDNMLNRVMIRDNIGLVALLETREGAWENGLPPDMGSVHQPLLVCTAHIHWDPEYCDVKLIQTMMLMNELQNIVEESARSFRPGSKKCDPSMMPLLLCGDFNSLPNSGVIDFLTSGRISVQHPDFKELAYESCLKKLSSSDKPSEYTHCFQIAKAYSNNIMPFTNYTFDFKGVIDYILHSDQSLVPLGLLGPLDAQWMKENKIVGCPHPHIPSDHFPLVAAYEMTPPQISLSNGVVLRR